MEEKEFQIGFIWQGMPYLAIVRPEEVGSDTWYTAHLESENQEDVLEVTLKPAGSAIADWDFFCNGEDATKYYDRDLLIELGEAIERKLIDEQSKDM